MTNDNYGSRDQEIVTSLTEVTIDTLKHLHDSFDELIQEVNKVNGQYSDLRLNGLELTYFCLALTTKLYIQFSNDKDFERKLDTLTKTVLYISLDLIEENLPKDKVASQYQSRYQSYQDVFNYYLKYNIYTPRKPEAEKGKEVLALRTLLLVYGKNMSDDKLFPTFIARTIVIVINELINFLQNDIKKKYFK